jgi:hypothetical protein
VFHVFGKNELSTWDVHAVVARALQVLELVASEERSRQGWEERLESSLTCNYPHFHITSSEPHLRTPTQLTQTLLSLFKMPTFTLINHHPPQNLPSPPQWAASKLPPRGSPFSLTDSLQPSHRPFAPPLYQQSVRHSPSPPSPPPPHQKLISTTPLSRKYTPTPLNIT